MLWWMCGEQIFRIFFSKEGPCAILCTLNGPPAWINLEIKEEKETSMEILNYIYNNSTYTDDVDQVELIYNQ